jgi:hypothetical protein
MAAVKAIAAAPRMPCMERIRLEFAKDLIDWAEMFIFSCRSGDVSAAHLKFLHRRRQILSRNFKWKSGTKNYGFPVPIIFRSS